MYREIFVGFLSILLIDHSYASSSLEIIGRELATDCDNNEYSIKCFKIGVIRFLEKLTSNQVYNVMPGVSVVRDLNASDVKIKKLSLQIARNFPKDSEKRLDALLLAKLTAFLKSYTLRLKLLDIKAIKDVYLVIIGGEGKIDDKKGVLGKVLAIAVVIKGLLGALAIKGLALLAGKAFATAVLALILSAVIGFKLLVGGHKQTTYEIISKPIYSHSNTHSSSYQDIHDGYGGYGHGRTLNFKLPNHLVTN